MISIIVPFLNGANWLSSFLSHHLNLIAELPDAEISLIEGATSFHSPAESRNGLSVDESDQIVEQYRSNKQLRYYRKGRVHTVSELITIAYEASQKRFLCVLSPTDFLTEPLLQEIFEMNAEIAKFQKISLIGDFSHKIPCVTALGYCIKNIGNLYFKNGNTEPVVQGNRPLSSMTHPVTLTARAISTELIETKLMRYKRLRARFEHQNWYYHNIEQTVPRCDDTQRITELELTRIETYKRQEIDNPTKEETEKIFHAHPWLKLSETEIYNAPIAFMGEHVDMGRLLKRIELSKRGNALEIGCATGGLLGHLKKEGWNVYGVEVSKWASRYAQYIEDLHVFTGMIEDYTPEVQFDLILLWDTIEHFDNPTRSLEKIRSLMKQNGILIVYTPCFEKFKTDKRHFLWSPGQHYFLYNEKSLSTLLKRCGFKILYTDMEYDHNGFLVGSTLA